MIDGKEVKLDMGSGMAHREGYITVDSDSKVGADVTVDIQADIASASFFWPEMNRWIRDNTVDEIRAFHILEHIKPENKCKVMQLFYDLLAPGGILHIEVPQFPHPASIQDPTHISFWCKDSFWYFTKGNKFGEGFVKHTSQPSPLFEFVEEEDKGWAFNIKLRKPE